MTTPPTSCTKPTLLTTSILIALGVGFGIPALANGGIVSLTKPNQGLRCIGTVKHNSKGSSGTNLCPAPSATSVRSNNPSPTAFGGNPINLLTGNKFEQLLDIDEVGDAFALRLTRYYNSQSTQRGIFGIGWRSDYELQLQDLGDNVQILTADGGLYHFNKQQIKDDSTGLLSERFVPDDISLGYVEVKPISHHTNALGDEMIWQWHLPDGRVMEFAPHRQVDKVNTVGRYQYGQLSRVQKLASNKNTQTLYWQLHYNTDGKLARVSNNLGQVLRFEYQTNDDGLSYINVSKEGTKIDKQIWQYRLDKIGNLLEVITHQGDRLGYEYGDPNDKHNLTAKYRYIQDNDKDSSNDGLKKQLISRFAYDAYDRAILSTGKGDTHKISVSYDDKATYSTLGDTYTNTLTNSLGQTTQYRYTYDKTGIRLLSAIGVGCMTCNQSNVRYEYNKEGRVIAKHALVQASTNPPTPTNFVGNDANIANEANILSSERYIYDDFGRVVKTMVQDHIAGSPTHTTNTTYISNDKDSPAFYLIKSISTDSVFSGKQTGIEYDYDDRGNVIRVKEFGFDGGGVLSERTTNIDYDDHNQPIKVYRQGNLDKEVLITKYTWLKVGVLQKIEEPLKNTTTTFYHNEKDLIVKLIRTQDDDELRFDFTYDDKGQANSMARYINGGLAGQVAYERDEFGQIAKVFDGNGQDLGFNTLNAGVNQGVLFDAVIMADLKQNTQTGQTPILSAFDKNTLRLTLGDGSQAVYKLDDFGRISAITHPQVDTHQYAYDSQGNLIQILLSDGRRIVYHYNNKGLRIKKEVYHANTNASTQDKPIFSTTWQYDDKDRLVGMNDNTQTVHYTYDNDNNVIQKTVQLSGLNTPLITKFSYQKDKDGKAQKVGITLPDGTVLSSKNNVISYQAPHSKQKSALLTKQTDGQASNTQTGQVSYVLGRHIIQSQYYDTMGNWAGLSYQPAQASSKDKITHGQHKNEPSSPLFSQHWQRGNNGLIDAITEQDKQGTHTYHYLYDDTNALLLSKQNSPHTKHDTYYAYDKLGNRVASQSKSSVGMMTLTQYRYDDKGRITGTNKSTHANTGATSTENNPISPSIQYDSAGKPITYGKYFLTYHNGRLSEVKYKDGKPVASYRYNELGQRVQKISYINAKGERISIPTTTHYIYEDSLLQHELDDKGNIIRHYVYMGDKLIATMDYDHQNQNTQSKTNHQDSLWQTLKTKFGNLATNTQFAPKIHYVISDHLGRPRQVLDKNNELVWQLTPTDFGGIVNQELQSKTGYTLNLRFSGQYEDKETGLYYNHHRYYDPTTGRYITPDPLGLAGGENLYTYVGNSPIHYNDPVGLLLFAFDGTGNQDYGIPPNQHSNVVKFRTAYRKDPNEPSFPDVTQWKGQNVGFGRALVEQNVFYISGADTRDQYSGIEGGSTDGGTGLSIIKRVDKMVEYLHSYFEHIEKNYTNTNKPKQEININLDIVGFSRGAASARMFASKVNNIMNNGSWYRYSQVPVQGGAFNRTETKWKYTHNWLKQQCNVKFNFNFMGLWDTVPAYGADQDNDIADLQSFEMPIAITAPFKKVVHAVAVNEHRGQFHGRSIFNNQADANTYNNKVLNGTHYLELGFLGAHSDIGGGYHEGDLSDVTLVWMANEANKLYKSQGTKTEIKLNTNDKRISNPIVHDSIGVERAAGTIIFSPSRQFRWAGTENGSVEQFTSIPHLKFNWEHSRSYQPKGVNRFDDIRRLSGEYMKRWACGPFINDCPEVDEIRAFKGIDGEGQPTILYGKGAIGNNQRYILIQDYINWLKNKGYSLDGLSVQIQ